MRKKEIRDAHEKEQKEITKVNTRVKILERRVKNLEQEMQVVQRKVK